jgi:hypothetical protein
MSRFHRHTTREYIEGLRKFLAWPKGTFKRDFGFTDETTKRGGPGPKYPVAAIAKVEAAVNVKAARAEARDTTLAERYIIARDYQGLTDAGIARQLGVSRELCRRWGIELNTPTNLGLVAQLLDVPVEWLKHGGDANFPADSHVGIRVGQESLNLREMLFSITCDILVDISVNANDDAVRVFIENAIRTRPTLATVARQAGGRWQVLNGSLVFAPWSPIIEHGLNRRLWPDEVEAKLELLQSTGISTYETHKRLKAWCDDKGLSCPKKISLYKRLNKKEKRALRFGVNLNSIVVAASAASACPI